MISQYVWLSIFLLLYIWLLGWIFSLSWLCLTREGRIYRDTINSKYRINDYETYSSTSEAIFDAIKKGILSGLSSTLFAMNWPVRLWKKYQQRG